MYVAVELKTKIDGSMEVSTFKKEKQEEAEKAFHSILATAATSEHPVHAAVVLNEFGVCQRSECYKHEVPEEKEGEE